MTDDQTHTAENPPPFPVDDATLLAIEHALNAALTYDRPEDAAPEDDGPWIIGAEFPLPTLLDFLAGCTGRDPNEELIQAGRDESDLPEWERGHGGYGHAEIVYDTRPHFSERDVIRALIDEVRRLRHLCLRCHGEFGWYGGNGVWEPCPDCDPTRPIPPEAGQG